MGTMGIMGMMWPAGGVLKSKVLQFCMNCCFMFSWKIAIFERTAVFFFLGKLLFLGTAGAT